VDLPHRVSKGREGGGARGSQLGEHGEQMVRVVGGHGRLCAIAVIVGLLVEGARGVRGGGGGRTGGHVVVVVVVDWGLGFGFRLVKTSEAGIRAFVALVEGF